MLAAFAIGQTVVTNDQFAAFGDAGGYQDESLWSASGWRWRESKRITEPGFRDDPHFNHALQPVVGVCWYEAQAFARWLARVSGLPWRLPTEVEWEAAARGPEGSGTLPRFINCLERGLGRTWAAVGTGGVTWCGARDMQGNVWEWTHTRWGHNWQSLDYPYPYNAQDGREDAEGSQARVMRGGSWFDPLASAQPAFRARYLPGSRGSNIGFRLARSLP
jgi:formylglycine-generating enzyme required for sulfatase activity